MIQVNRGLAPDGFASQSAAWQEEFKNEQHQDVKVTSARFWSKVRQRPAMKQYADILSQRFHAKCAFCESTMKHVTPMQIEHFRPKGMNQFPHLMFVWDNWLISCPTCNANKSTKFPFCESGEPCFIDPAKENPSEHIDFLESQILPKTNRGNETIQEIGLNRNPLTEERTRWLLTIVYYGFFVLLLKRIPQ